MLTLITGVPGSGKTAGAVDLIVREYKDRPLYVDGLNGLTLEHVPVDVMDWPTEVPDGAVVVVDEVQRKWRPRGPGGKVPDSVAALETHRHRGLDFVLITQNPRLLDTNVRALVGRHVHIRDTGWMGRWWYEWPECNESLAWAKCQNKRRYKLPKKVFDLYKSASLHTKPVRKIPLMLYILAAVVIAITVLGYSIWQDRKNVSELPALPSVESVKPGQLPTLSPEGSKSAAVPAGEAPGQGPPDERVDFVPRLPDRPWTAPAYDHLRRVVAMPSIGGGLCIRGRCTCYSEAGTRLDLSHDACSEWMQTRPFDPYKTPPAPPVAGQPGPAPGAAVASAAQQQEGPRVVPGPSGVSNPRLDLAKPAILF